MVRNITYMFQILLLSLGLSLCGNALAEDPATGPFVTFDSGQVRPLALSLDGQLLFVVNTPDNRLEIFSIGANGLEHVAMVPVGLEPVAVAARTSTEVWVVNHLSDSVSIIDIGSLAGGGSGSDSRVVRTLLVGDEPRDIVFGGPNRERAFITTAHRGQNSPVSFSPLVNQGRADVWAFDALAVNQASNGLLDVITMFGDTPRALAVSEDGSTVYAAVFKSGNRSTVLPEAIVAGNLPPPLTNIDGEAAPDVGLIVKFDGTDWLDGAGRPWTNQVNVSLPDWDVFAIDAMANPPQEIDRWSGVGTTLFNMVVNPATGSLYVSNLEARNHVRFEGPGVFGGSTVRGHIAESRITVIDGVDVNPRHLNKHIDYSSFPGTPTENANSLAFPLGMAITGDGSTLYTTAFGSGKVGIFDVTELDDDSFTPDEANHIALSGGGPSGLVLDEARNRMYVLTRFDNAISTVDLTTHTEIDHIALFNPEPASVVAGRPFLYDARYTSSRGDSACASCHIFADTDHLSWDLGNPDASVATNPNPFITEPSPDLNKDFHPMKGPMSTQSLRGMANHGPMHWRGDRTNPLDPFDEVFAFKEFNGAFEGLIGRAAPLTDPEMQAFADFALQIVYPPNPIRNLNNSLTPSQQRGSDFFFFTPVPTPVSVPCNDCHTIDASAGLFGSSLLSVVRPFGPTRQAMKVPHLRNLYTKVGLFRDTDPVIPESVRGFGFVNDGSVDTLFNFAGAFLAVETQLEQLNLTNFLLASETNLAPIVGQQVTLRNDNRPAVRDRLNLLYARAAVELPRPECDLVVKGVVNNIQRGWIYRPTIQRFRSDRASEPLLTRIQLHGLTQAAGHELSFMCVPVGSGRRIAIDRDGDNFLDRDELDAGSDPADPLSTPVL